MSKSINSNREIKTINLETKKVTISTRKKNQEETLYISSTSKIYF